MTRQPESNHRQDVQRERLLAAAAQVFLEHGFGLATVDVIAARAKASKKTLYAHFAHKEEIFVAAVERLCREALSPLHGLAPDETDPGRFLVAFGTRLLAQVLSPQAVALHRMAIAEAVRFPEFSRLFHRTGPAMVQAILAQRLASFSQAGQMPLADPDMVASLFIQMVLGEFQRQVGMAVRAPPGPAEAAAHTARVAALLLRGVGAECDLAGADRNPL